MTWAELMRGQPITAHPHLNRACVQARASSRAIFRHEEYIIHKATPAVGGVFVTGAEPPPAMAFRVFEFFLDDIQALKAHASTEGGDEVSHFQALAAHIWKHVTKARGTQDASQMTKLRWPVNGRNRFDPPLPANYFGNVVFLGGAEARVEEVIAQPLGQTADLIRSGTRRCTDVYMQSALSLLAGQASPAFVSESLFTDTDLGVSIWLSFNVYEIKWGWGRPVYFTWLSPISSKSEVALLPHPSSPGAVNVLIALPRIQMSALLSDTAFHPISEV